MRLFTSIDPPPEIRQAVAKLCTGLPQMRWIAPAQLHLTLVFIGEVEPARLEPIIQQLSQVRFEPFRLDCQGLGRFSSGALWLGVAPQPQLLRLQQSISAQLGRIDGLRPATRGYQPHLTLGRLPRRQPTDLQAFIAAHRHQRFSFEVDHFELKASQLLAQGALYQTLSRFVAHARRSRPD